MTEMPEAACGNPAGETIRGQMLSLARRGAEALGPKRNQTATFLASLAAAAGGYRGRDERHDLYYSAFVLMGLRAMDHPVEEAPLRHWLGGYDDGANLDLVHLCCLIRCWALLEYPPSDEGLREALCRKVLACRSEDGGFAPQPRASAGTGYAAFLAGGALEDLAAPIPNPRALAEAITNLKRNSGYAHSRAIPLPNVPTTAAAVVLLDRLGLPDSSTAEFLRSCLHNDGGLCAAPGAPLADLLSTATGLFALLRLDTTLPPPQRDACRAFLQDRRTNTGGFTGSRADPTADGEYTFYALLALGALDAMDTNDA